MLYRKSLGNGHFNVEDNNASLDARIRGRSGMRRFRAVSESLSNPRILADKGMAAPQGFEPRYADPESAVLPLNEGAALVKKPLDELDQF